MINKKDKEICDLKYPAEEPKYTCPTCNKESTARDGHYDCSPAEEECEKCGYLLKNHKVGSDKCPQININYSPAEVSKICSQNDGQDCREDLEGNCYYCGKNMLKPAELRKDKCVICLQKGHSYKEHFVKEPAELNLASQSIEEDWKKEFMQKCFDADKDAFLSISGGKANFIANWWLEKISLARTEEFQKGKNWAKDMAYNAWIPCAVAEYQAELVSAIQKLNLDDNMTPDTDTQSYYNGGGWMQKRVLDIIHLISPNKE